MFSARFLFLAVSAAAAAAADSSPAELLGNTACGLFQPLEIERTLHVSVGDRSPHVNMAGVTSCLYRAGRGSISIVVRRNASRDWVAEQRRRMSRSDRVRPVSAVGDAAFVLDAREKGGVLCVFDGGNYLQISVFTLGGAAAVLPGMTQLARLGLSRLR